jgi:hypothetical protein
MMFENPVRLAVGSVLLMMGSLAATAQAQSSVGTGPLTSTLTDTEPVAGVLSLGRVKAAPGVTVRELGWDDNVFDESPDESPKQDYVVAAVPDVSVFTRLRFVRLSAYAGSELTYYQQYESERSVGYAGRGRADFLLSRVRPFIGGGRTKTRSRANGEIDVRANRVEEELSTGIAFDVSEHSLFYGAAYKSSSHFEAAFQDGIDLSGALSRDSFNYQGGLKTDLTPLLSIQLFGSYQEDEFRSEPVRNAIGKAVTAMLRFAPEAVVTGMLTVSYRDTHFADPGLKPFKGLVGNAALTYPILEIGRLTASAQRGVEYSFDAAEAYYVENTGSLTYTHRLFGAVDVQGRVARSLFDYSARATEPPHKDTLDSAAGSLGYNLRNRTRIALNYEYSRRRSPALSARNYQRRRVYLSWLFAF